MHAIEKFFPETEIVDDHGTPDAQRVSTSSRDSERLYPLQRINTGNSSIVGPNNGDRPGGFVLVIDGTALGDVSWGFIYSASTETDAIRRHDV